MEKASIVTQILQNVEGAVPEFFLSSGECPGGCPEWVGHPVDRSPRVVVVPGGELYVGSDIVVSEGREPLVPCEVDVEPLGGHSVEVFEEGTDGVLEGGDLLGLFEGALDLGFLCLDDS